MKKFNPIGPIAALLVATAFAGCVERTSFETSEDSEKVAQFILKKAPAKMDRSLNANFDNKVVLLGYDIDRREAAPGEKVMVDWYWEGKEPPGAGWKIFTHMVDGSDASRINKDMAGPVRKHFQPEHWRKGTIIKDPQQITIPKKWGSSTVSLRIGLWSDSGRMKIVEGPRDKDMRIKGPTITVKTGDPLKKYVIPRASTAPEMDGRWLEEDAWKGALDLGEFTNTLDGSKVPFDTDARVMWDDENIYLAVIAKDDFLRSKYTKHDDELWHEDAFEVFLDPGADKKDYYEIQVSPAGVVFDSYLPRYRKNTNEWSSNARVAVFLDGTLNDGEGGDKGWSAEVVIPIAALNEGKPASTGAGDIWAMNFFRVDATEKRPRYSAWSPPLRGDFHALDRFAQVVFEQPAKSQAPVIVKDAGPGQAQR